jgi:hypothetical protein
MHGTLTLVRRVPHLSLCEQFEERRVPEGIDWIVLWLFARTTAAALQTSQRRHYCARVMPSVTQLNNTR